MLKDNIKSYPNKDNDCEKPCENCAAYYTEKVEPCNAEIRTKILKKSKKKRQRCMDDNSQDSFDKQSGNRSKYRQKTSESCYPVIKIENCKIPKKKNKYCIDEDIIGVYENTQSKEENNIATCDAEVKSCVDNYRCKSLFQKCPACKPKKNSCKNKRKPKVKKEESFHETSFVECGICEIDAESDKPCKSSSERFCENRDCNVAKIYENRNKTSNIIDDIGYPSKCCYRTITIDSRKIPIDEEACPLGKCGSQKEFVQDDSLRKLCQSGSYCASDAKKTQCPVEENYLETPKYSCSRSKCIDECKHAAARVNKKTKQLKELYDPNNKKKKYLYSDRPLYDSTPDHVFEKFVGEKKLLLFKYPIKGVCPNCKGLSMTGKLCYVPEKIKEKKDKKPIRERIRNMYKSFSIK